MNELIDLAKQIVRDMQVQGRKPGLRPGCQVWWRGADRTIRGPALVEHLWEEGPRTWVVFTYQGTDHILNSQQIERITETA
jgi:hypothetical protein